MNFVRWIGIGIFLMAAMVPSITRADDALPGRWSQAKANDWYRERPWMVGCNYITSTAINELEMFQPDTFDLPTIDRELGYAQGLGFNSIRVFLHNLLWDQDSAGFLSRLDQFVAVADKHHIGVMFVLLDSCWDPHPALGKQREPFPHRHNSGWVQAPGIDILRDPSKYDSLKPYIQGVVGHFKNDHRVVVWDLMNEQDNTNGDAYGKVDLSDQEKTDCALKLMTKLYSWCREIDPEQPLTTCVWRGDYSNPATLTPINAFDLNNSDVINYHCYDPLPGMKKVVHDLRQYGRPLLCTEYMARPVGSTFATILPFLKQQHIAAYNWGFVSGKTQTIYPWDSWKKTYTAEPPLWFHDIFRTDGTPYKQAEVALIRKETGVKPQ
jgi:hypothetical protein